MPKPRGLISFKKVGCYKLSESGFTELSKLIRINAQCGGQLFNFENPLIL
jgi:hypothetical protein